MRIAVCTREEESIGSWWEPESMSAAEFEDGTVGMFVEWTKQGDYEHGPRPSLRSRLHVEAAPISISNNYGGNARSINRNGADIRRRFQRPG